MTREQLLETAKPILFNTQMVKAILNGEKTVTRRLIKNKDIINGFDIDINGKVISYIDQSTGDRYSPEDVSMYKVGDIIYVRETWGKQIRHGGSFLVYRADDKNAKNYDVNAQGSYETGVVKWKPSIHMPKKAARIFLKVTDVKVERLNDMCQEDCIKEGCGELSEEQFAQFWNLTIKKQDLNKYSWQANPWVWVIEFERIEV